LGEESEVVAFRRLPKGADWGCTGDGFGASGEVGGVAIAVFLIVVGVLRLLLLLLFAVLFLDEAPKFEGLFPGGFAVIVFVVVFVVVGDVVVGVVVVVVPVENILRLGFVTTGGVSPDEPPLRGEKYVLGMRSIEDVKHNQSESQNNKWQKQRMRIKKKNNNNKTIRILIASNHTSVRQTASSRRLWCHLLSCSSKASPCRSSHSPIATAR
jgi:hypothetical protein